MNGSGGGSGDGSGDGGGGGIGGGFDYPWPELPCLDTQVSDVLEGVEVDRDPRYTLTPHQFDKLHATQDYKQDPTQRLVRLDGGARTLISHYRSGFALRSEFVWRHPSGSSNGTFPVAGGEMPRFFTARECARLQGFPESHILGEVGEAGGKGNGNRLYYQLGNAVCPVVVAAIANSLLAVIGLSGEPPGGFNKGGSIVGGGGGGATRAVVETADPHMLNPGKFSNFDHFVRAFCGWVFGA